MCVPRARAPRSLPRHLRAGRVRGVRLFVLCVRFMWLRGGACLGRCAVMRCARSWPRACAAVTPAAPRRRRRPRRSAHARPTAAADGAHFRADKAGCGGQAVDGGGGGEGRGRRARREGLEAARAGQVERDPEARRGRGLHGRLAAAAAADARTGGGVLRGARGEAVLRGARAVHVLRAMHLACAGARGRRARLARAHGPHEHGGGFRGGAGAPPAERGGVEPARAVRHGRHAQRCARQRERICRGSRGGVLLSRPRGARFVSVCVWGGGQHATCDSVCVCARGAVAGGCARDARCRLRRHTNGRSR